MYSRLVGASDTGNGAVYKNQTFAQLTLNSSYFNISGCLMFDSKTKNVENNRFLFVILEMEIVISITFDTGIISVFLKVTHSSNHILLV